MMKKIAVLGSGQVGNQARDTLRAAMPSRTLGCLMILAACVVASACAAPAARTQVRFPQGGDLSALGLAPCVPSQREVVLAPNRPVPRPAARPGRCPDPTRCAPRWGPRG